MSIAIRDGEKSVLILEAFSWLDDIRWIATDTNYSTVNCAYNDPTPDEKLLTHWLSYITDRQTPFQRIWDVGGYVISHMVRTFASEDGRDVRDLLLSYVRQSGDKLWLECPREADNIRLARHGITGATVTFASRYMPDDLAKMYRTMEILSRHSKRSLGRFIAGSLDLREGHWQAIRRAATALDQLTYAVGKVSLATFDEALNSIASGATAFTFPSKCALDLFNRKRLWCSLRDCLKDPALNRAFVAALDQSGMEDAGKWLRTNPELREALGAMELPGDVWNNADAIRDGLFRHYLDDVPPSWDMPRVARSLYELLRTNGSLGFYPEQLDVTFDFVPRMCQRRMCDVCLFGRGIAEICHQKPGCLCPIALSACGYRHTCNPEGCWLRQHSVADLCKSSDCSSR